MRACPTCGEENPERFKFCGVCGSSLEAPAATTAEERKVVSVLFVDLVGFTASSERADPEDVRARLRPYHSMLKHEIERFGGTVEKFIGDAVMAVFGAPVAHEDDAERAVRAALRITEAIPELNEANPGLELSFRAAVNTGEAVVALGARPERGEGFVAGDVVNTASRLQGVAPVGGVVVGEITYRTTKDAIEYAPLGPVHVKGKEDAIAIWQAVRAHGRFTTEIERPSTPFIGRRTELSLLQQTFTRALNESSVQLVTVTGEPGVGKSRLTSEFFTWIDDRPDIVFWRHGRCLPYGEGITFWAVGEIVKAHAGILESDSPEDAARKVAVAVDAVVEEDSEREWLKARLAPLVGSETTAAATDRSEAFAAWRTFIEAVASARPLVLLVEDLHWADGSMLEFVEHLVDWTTGVPLLVLCTARPELYEQHPGWGGGKRNSTTIGLSPLSGDETAQLISALLSEAVLPAETQEALLERAGGNPLYAEEFVRMLLDRGILEHRGRSVTLTTDAEIPVPESVQAIIAARLDTLSADRKALMHDAAVVGRVFWSGLVASMSGRVEDEVRKGLHELARKELVRPARRPSIEGQAEYAFWHILVRDVAYGQIPRAARAAKHRAAAEWIEKVAATRVGDHAEILAFHYLEALSLARAAGSDQEATLLSERATEFLVLAGARAFNLDVKKAESFYRQALELAPTDHAGRGSILLHLGQTESELARYDDAVRDFEEAIAALRSAGDVVGMGDAHARLARTLWRRGDTTRAHALAQTAVELLEKEPPSPELANAYNEVGRLSMLAGSHEESIRYTGMAIKVSEELGLQGPIVRALDTRGPSLAELGRLEEGIDDLRKARRLGTELGLGYETATAYLNLAYTLERVDGPAAAFEVAEEGVDFAHSRGLAFMEMWIFGGTVSDLFALGRWGEALSRTEKVLDWERGRSAGQLGVVVRFSRARILVHLGRADEAAAMIEEFLPRAREVGDPQVVVPALAIAAEVELARGRPDAAVQLVGEIRSIAEEGRGWQMYELAASARVLVRCGKVDDAAALISGVAPRWAEDRAKILSARAVIEEARGMFDQALSLYQEAREAWTKFGSLVERTHARLGEGRCLVQLDRKQEAAESLREARDSFASFGGKPLTAETHEWLARATRLSS